MIVDGTKAISQIKVLIDSTWLPGEAVKAFEQAINIIQGCDLDSCGDGLTITLEDGNELSPHVFEEYETIENATVHLMRCENCGKEEIWWERR